MAININKLGIRVDGWADLVEGAGDKVAAARHEFERIAQEKNLPSTSINPTSISPTYGNKQRNYTVLEMANGATVASYIGSFGNDLYAKWDVYVRALWNMNVIFGLLAVSAVFSFIAAASNRYGDGLSIFIVGLAGLFGGGAILIAIAGLITRRNPLAFFFKQLDEFDLDDIGAMTLATHKAMLRALDLVGIQSQTLRIKEHFAAGVRNRLI